MDSYLTLAGSATARLTRERSRFLARVEPTSAREVHARVAELRREHHDATHVCVAYRVRIDDKIEARADDAGEPQGSAGLPILQRLEAAGLVDTLGVVVRHFGGVKLGLGGLVRAYGDAIAAAIEHAERVERSVQVTLRVRFPATANPAVLRAIHRHGARLLDIRYDTDVEARVALPPSRAQGFQAMVRDESGARASVTEEK